MEAHSVTTATGFRRNGNRVVNSDSEHGESDRTMPVAVPVDSTDLVLVSPGCHVTGNPLATLVHWLRNRDRTLTADRRWVCEPLWTFIPK